MKKIEFLILGSGIAGLSASFHVGHNRCLILEKQEHAFGTLFSEKLNGFTWDKGPHVSFTKSVYVQELFKESVEGLYVEKEVKVGNYFKGHWLDHPVQSNLYQVPEPLRSECVASFLDSRETKKVDASGDYGGWLVSSLGPKITENFVAPYTRKYWTVEPDKLSLDWIGGRIYKPNVDDVIKGSLGKLEEKTHYVNSIRYPAFGGYQSFANKLFIGSNIINSCAVVKVDLQNNVVHCQNGDVYEYENLISTIPLPQLVPLVTNISPAAIKAAENLSCSELLLLNIEVDEVTSRPEDWLYVYDEDKYCTRINFTEKLSKNNAPDKKSGIQVEVYFSKYKPFNGNIDSIGAAVVEELFEMGIISNRESADNARINPRFIKYANVIFDHERRASLDKIFSELSNLGLSRNDGDLDALTDWNKLADFTPGNFYLLGRFGEWKYYWSDDCVLSGKRLANVTKK
jgi:protoporphyrinogen oxidase